MAVVIKKKSDKYQCEFHRNPSGFHNKVNWILVKSKYDCEKIFNLLNTISVFNDSWRDAFYLASLIALRRFNFAKTTFPQHWKWIKKRYVNSLRRNK